MKALLQKRLSLRDLTQTTFGSLGNSEVEIGRFTYGIDSANILQWGRAKLRLGIFCSIAHGATFFWEVTIERIGLLLTHFVTYSLRYWVARA